MNKKSWFLIGLLAVLGVVYIIYFTDWFRTKPILIGDMERFGHVYFSFSQPYRLTSVKVLSVSELESNKYALPVWELNSDSNSVPIERFAYGQRIRGMKPAVKGTKAEPLDHGAKYRLYVEVGALKGQHDFAP
jgi:hypothetical protein